MELDVTTPQVVTILEALGCRIVSAALWQYFPAGPRRFEGALPSDPIMFRSDAAVDDLAREIKAMEAAGTLPDMYCRPLEFTIFAQRT